MDLFSLNSTVKTTSENYIFLILSFPEMQKNFFQVQSWIRNDLPSL